MSNTIQIKRKTTTGAPLIGSLVDGEMCLVVPDSKLYQRADASTLILINGGGGGGGETMFHYRFNVNEALGGSNWYGVLNDYNAASNSNYWTNTGKADELDVYSNTTTSSAVPALFTAPYNMKIEKIIISIDNDLTYTFKFSLGKCLRVDGASTVSNPATLFTSDDVATTNSSNWLKKTFTEAEFGNLTVSEGEDLMVLLKYISGPSGTIKINNFDIYCKKI